MLVPVCTMNTFNFKKYCIFIMTSTGSAPPSFVLGLCSNVVWKAPRRTYGRIIGYDIRFVRDNQTLTFTKAKDEFFHLVKPKDFPDDSDTFVQVSMQYWVVERCIFNKLVEKIIAQ